MINFRIAIFFVILMTAIQNAFPQSIEFGKTTINQNEEFSVVLTLPKETKKELKSILFPEIQDFIKVKTQFEEDKKLKIYKITQTYSPLKAGFFKMLPFQMSMGDKKINSRGTKITVLNNLSKNSTIPKPENIRSKSEKEEIFFKITSDKNAVFAGQGFTITAYLLIGENNKTRFNFFDLNNQILNVSRNLTTSNCLMDEYSKSMIEQLEFDSILIQKKYFKRLKLYEAEVYPINAGEITFPSGEFKIIKYQSERIDNDILWKAEELKLISQPLKIKVKTLPEHPLKDKVAVGNFQLKEDVSPGKIKTGKSFKYNLIITGTGNISTVIMPEIKESDSLDFFPPVIKQHTFTKEGIHIGQKIFSYQIVPKEPGKYKLADYFQWVYFDPLKKNYDTLSSAINLNVTGESQKNKQISSTDFGSFYELAGKESNELRSKEKDQSIKFFANIIILFMLVTTAILIFRR